MASRKFFLTPSRLIGFLFLGIPIWWILGIEQFIWPVFTTFLVFCEAQQRRKRGQRLRWNSGIRLAGVFLVAYLTSGLFIVENFRYITFVQVFLIYWSGFMLIIYLYNKINDKRQIDQILWYVSIFSLIAGLIALPEVAGVANVRFQAPIRFVLPQSLLNTGTGYYIVHKSVGEKGLLYTISTFRVKSFFLSATMYAFALVVIIPLQLYLLQEIKGIMKKMAVALSLMVGVFNLYLSLVRMAWIALTIGVLTYFMLSLTRRLKPMLKLAALNLLSATFVLAMWWLPPSRSLQHLYEYVKPYVMARSFSGRSLIYARTIEAWRDRWLFGWGAQRDLLGADFVPAGSHSDYLGILFKHGAFGLSVALLFQFSVFRSAYHGVRGNSLPATKNLATWCLVGLIAVFLHKLTEVVSLDAITFHIVWLLYGITFVIGRIVDQKSSDWVKAR